MNEVMCVCGKPITREDSDRMLEEMKKLHPEWFNEI